MAFALNDIQLFQLLKDKMGDKEAEALVTFVDAKVKESVKETNEQNLKVLATREDLSKDISKVNEKIADLRTELKTDIANSKTDMIKWMVVFWLTQMAAIIALYFKK